MNSTKSLIVVMALLAVPFGYSYAGVVEEFFAMNQRIYKVDETGSISVFHESHQKIATINPFSKAFFIKSLPGRLFLANQAELHERKLDASATTRSLPLNSYGEIEGSISPDFSQVLYRQGFNLWVGTVNYETISIDGPIAVTEGQIANVGGPPALAWSEGGVVLFAGDSGTYSPKVYRLRLSDKKVDPFLECIHGRLFYSIGNRTLNGESKLTLLSTTHEKEEWKVLDLNNMGVYTSRSTTPGKECIVQDGAERKKRQLTIEQAYTQHPIKWNETWFEGGAPQSRMFCDLMKHQVFLTRVNRTPNNLYIEEPVVVSEKRDWDCVLTRLAPGGGWGLVVTEEGHFVDLHVLTSQPAKMEKVDSLSLGSASQPSQTRIFGDNKTRSLLLAIRPIDNERIIYPADSSDPSRRGTWMYHVPTREKWRVCDAILDQELLHEGEAPPQFLHLAKTNTLVFRAGGKLWKLTGSDKTASIVEPVCASDVPMEIQVYKTPPVPLQPLAPSGLSAPPPPEFTYLKCRLNNRNLTGTALFVLPPKALPGAIGYMELKGLSPPESYIVEYERKGDHVRIVTETYRSDEKTFTFEGTVGGDGKVSGDYWYLDKSYSGDEDYNVKRAKWEGEFSGSR